MNTLSVILQLVPILIPVITDVEKAVAEIKDGNDPAAKSSVIDKAVDDVATALKAILHSVFN
jgi:hypothetical protein